VVDLGVARRGVELVMGALVESAGPVHKFDSNDILEGRRNPRRDGRWQDLVSFTGACKLGA
jgi:hypothetical protein